MSYFRIVMSKLIDFQQRLKDRPVFSLQDIYSEFPDFSYRQLNRWLTKGYLNKLRRNFYCLSDQIKNEKDLFVVANKIYAPSYISLEQAFKVYNFIPEGVLTVTSVSTRKTARFKTDLGYFSYQKIQPRLFWGYRLIEVGQQTVLLAEPEKAILDYLYLKPRLKTVGDFESLRFDLESFVDHVDSDKINQYARLFAQQSLIARLANFLEAVKNA